MATGRHGLASPTMAATLAPLLADLLQPTPLPLPPAVLDERPAALTDGDLYEITEALEGFLRMQYRRQGGNGPTFPGYPPCNNVDNSVLSCYPQTNDTIVQNQWSRFVWNSRYPTFIGAAAVDIYLYHADSDALVYNYTGVPNARGSIGASSVQRLVKAPFDVSTAIQPDDSWMPTQTSWTAGRNITRPYYFVVVASGTTLTGGEPRQAVFDVIQTAPPATLSAALASSSAALSASTAAAIILSASALSALSSAIAAGATTLSGAQLSSFASAVSGLSSAVSNASNGAASGRPTRGALAADPVSSGFPAYAIAILAVLGGLLLFFALCTAFLLLRLRRKRRRDHLADGEQGVRQPILAPGGGPSDSPVEKEEASPTSDRGVHSFADPALVAGAAGAATHGRASHGSTGEESGMSSADAALMAEAFRKALRQPEFPEGSGDPSPSSGTTNDTAQAGTNSGVPPTANETGFGAAVVAANTAPLLGPARPRSRLSSSIRSGDGPEAVGRELIDKELASEGRSMRSVADLKHAALVDAGEDEHDHLAASTATGRTDSPTP